LTAELVKGQDASWTSWWVKRFIKSALRRVWDNQRGNQNP